MRLGFFDEQRPRLLGTNLRTKAWGSEANSAGMQLIVSMQHFKRDNYTTPPTPAL